MIQLICAPHTDLLMQQLMQNLSVQEISPFDENWAVVPNHAARQWVEQQCANQLGICSQIKFIQPNSLIWSLIQLSGIEISPGYRPESMVWQLSNSDLVDVSDYLNLLNITALLQKYVQERPEWILQWDKDGASCGHAAIWKDLHDRLNTPHAVSALDLFEFSSIQPHLPQSLHVFLPEHISPLFLLYLNKLSAIVPVCVYMVNPVIDDYWFKIASTKQQALQKIKDIETETFTDDPYLYVLDVGNSVLANLGRQKANMLDFLIEQEDINYIEIIEQGSDTGQDSLLGSIRKDIRYNVEKPAKCSMDNSLQIHACHNQLREIEVSKDLILSILSDQQQMQPKDILVVAPDINDYAHTIDQIFQQTPSLDYHIDRFRQADSEAVQLFMLLINSFNGVMESHTISQLLELPIIRNQFKITDELLPSVIQWIHKSNVLWGYDSQHRSMLDAEKTDSNTWKQAKNKWLQGYLKGKYEHNDPYLQTFGLYNSDTEVFGQIFSFLDQWYASYTQAQAAQDLSEWYEWLIEVQKVFLGDVQQQFIKPLSKLFLEKKDQKITFNVMTLMVETALSEQNYRSVGEIGVRFQSWENACLAGCDVLLLLGMNSGDFPQAYRPDRTDLCAMNPHPLGKNMNLRDKNLLLGALSEPLAYLAITYQGFSPQDNSALDPSPLVSQLIEYVEEKTSATFNIKKHTMHGFNPQNFVVNEAEDMKPSFSKKNHDLMFGVAAKEQNKTFERVAKTADDHGASASKTAELSLLELISFAVNPQKYYMHRIIDVDPSLNAVSITAVENYRPDHLQRWQMNHLLSEYPDDSSVLHKSEILTQDKLGTAQTRNYVVQRESQRHLAQQIQQMQLDVKVDGVSINGSVPVVNHRLTTVIFSPVTTSALIRHWIQHLIWFLQTGEAQSQLVATDRKLQWDCSEASHLLPWIKYFNDSQQLAPLFAPKYAIKLNKTFTCTTEDEYMKRLENASSYRGDPLVYLHMECLKFDGVERSIQELIEPMLSAVEHNEFL